MKEKDKRTIPRNVEDRVMIGLMPFKTLVKISPIYIVVVLMIMKFFSPQMVFIGMLCICIITYLFSEIENKETGFKILKDILRYKKEGNIYFERSCTIRNEIDRITYNKIKKN